MGWSAAALLDYVHRCLLCSEEALLAGLQPSNTNLVGNAAKEIFLSIEFMTYLLVRHLRGALAPVHLPQS